MEHLRKQLCDQQEITHSLYLERECPMDRYFEILDQGHLERKSSLQIFNEYQGPLDSHKGYNSNTVSLMSWDIGWVKD